MKLINSCALLFVFAANLCAQMSGVFDYRLHQNPEGDKFFDFYYRFEPYNMQPEYTDSLHVKYSIEVTTLFTDTAKQILNFDKTQYTSPVFHVDSVYPFYFSNKISAPNATTDIEIDFLDVKSTESFKVNAVSRKELTSLSSASVSTPLLLQYTDGSALFARNDKFYDVVFDNTYNKRLGKMEFYVESVVTDQNQDENFVLRMMLNDENSTKLQRIVRFTKEESPLSTVASFPLDEVVAGAYTLKMLLYNKQMEIVDSSQIDLQIEVDNTVNFLALEEGEKDVEYTDADVILNASFISSVNDLDTLNDYLSCLYPIADDFEKYRLRKPEDAFESVKDRKLFFYHFWEKRNPSKPDIAWNDYYQMVKETNANFTTPIKKGHESDRGNIYLKYGKPNTIASRPNEPESLPYEIWHYYKLGRYNNIKFVFYSPDMVTNDYQLLHSNMPQELRNPQWRVVLKQRNNTNPNELNTDPGESYGGRSEDLFAIPR